MLPEEFGKSCSKEPPAGSQTTTGFFQLLDSSTEPPCVLNLARQLEPFPPRHHRARQAITEHVDRRARHVEDGVHAQQHSRAFHAADGT